MLRRILTGAAVGVLLVGLGGPARADGGSDEQRNERDLHEAEREQGGHDAGACPDCGRGGEGLADNPLAEILRLMNNVEHRLVESDTGQFTQKEQRELVEAMRFEEKTHQALEALIKKIEDQPP